MGRDIFNLIRLLKAPSNLERFWDRASTTSLDSLFPCLTTLIIKNVFLISKLNLPSFSVKPSPLGLPLQALVEKSFSIFLVSRIYILKRCIKSGLSKLWTSRLGSEQVVLGVWTDLLWAGGWPPGGPFTPSPSRSLQKLLWNSILLQSSVSWCSPEAFFWWGKDKNRNVANTSTLLPAHTSWSFTLSWVICPVGDRGRACVRMPWGLSRLVGWGLTLFLKNSFMNLREGNSITRSILSVGWLC